jgi:hypothetical protein
LLHARLRQVVENASRSLADLDAAVARAHEKTNTGWLGFALFEALATLAVAIGLGEVSARLARRIWLRIL